MIADKNYKNRLAPKPKDKGQSSVTGNQSSVTGDGKGKGETGTHRKLEYFTAPPHRRAVT